MRKIAALLADSHSGHLLGLCNPAWRLQDQDHTGHLVERAPRITAFQEWLWEKHLENLAKLQRLAAGDPIVVLHVGDLTHGSKYPHQLSSTRQSDQVELACANLAPLLNWPNVIALRIIEGTAAHNLGEGTTELLAARLLKERYCGLDVAVLAHSAVRINGVACDVAHHGPSAGSRLDLRGDALRRYVKALLHEAVLCHEEPARVFVRAHYHQYVHEVVTTRPNGCEYTADAIIMPPLCGMSEHGRQATRSQPRISVGMVAVETVDGQLTHIWPLLHTADLRTVEEL
jgi:hypothetical protein